MNSTLAKYVGYVSHSYDLIFFARLSEYLNSELDLLINSRLFTNEQRIMISRSFPHLKVKYLDFGEEKSSSIKRIIALKRFQNSQELINSKTLISLDKSKLSSRLLMKNHKEKILLQTSSVEINNLKFDLYLSSKRSLKSLFMGLGLTKIYSDNYGYSFEMVVKLFGAKVLKSNIQFLPIDENETGTRASNEILIFGSRFTDWPFFGQNQYALLIELYKKVLESLGVKKVRYMPHPRESSRELEYLRANLDFHFDSVDGYLNAEHYMLFNKNITHTFSIGSTASRSSAQFGLISIVGFRCLNFEQSVRLMFENIFLGESSINFDCEDFKKTQYDDNQVNTLPFDNRLLKLILNDKRYCP